jgi:hypothetical protein
MQRRAGRGATLRQPIEAEGRMDPSDSDVEEGRGRPAIRHNNMIRSQGFSAPAARRRRDRERQRARHRAASTARGEGETWASRTEEEGSLIVACCDQTVKFFEVWAGKSKGSAGGKGLGNRQGVLGGSRILEGWCEGIGELAGHRGRAGRWSEEIESIR